MYTIKSLKNIFMTVYISQIEIYIKNKNLHSSPNHELLFYNLIQYCNTKNENKMIIT